MATANLPGGNSTDGGVGYKAGWRGAYSQLTLPTGENADSAGDRPILITQVRSFVSGDVNSAEVRLGFGSESARTLAPAISRAAASKGALTSYQTCNAVFSNGGISRRFYIQTTSTDDFIRVGINGSGTNVIAYSLSGDTAVNESSLAKNLCGDFIWFSAPPRPTSVSAFSGSSAGTLSVSWGAPTIPASGTGSSASAITGYVVQTATNNTFTSGSKITTFSSGSTSGTITGLTAGTTYFVRAASTNAVTTEKGTYSAWTATTSATAASAVVVEPEPTVTISWNTSATLANASLNQTYSTTLSATNATSYTLRSGSNLPAGLSLESSTGKISGTATAIGTSSFTIRASATNATSVDRTFSLTVADNTPAWSDTSIATNFKINNQITGDLQISANNIRTTNPYVITRGNLPAGISFNQQTGVFSGTPTVAGSYPIGITAYGTNTGSQTTEASFTFNISFAGRRMTASNQSTQLSIVKRYAPLEAGADASGWKNISFIKRWNGTAWVDATN